MDVDRVTGPARGSLGDGRFATAFARGEALPPEEAVALAGQP